MSIIYETETEERREYLASLYNDLLKADDINSFGEFKGRLDRLSKVNLATALQQLTPRELSLYYYYKGEENKDSMARDLWKRLGNKIRGTDFINREETKFRRINNKTYDILTDNSNNIVVNKVNINNKIKTYRTERYIIRGKPVIRNRDSKGRFISVK